MPHSATETSKSCVASGVRSGVNHTPSKHAVPSRTRIAVTIQSPCGRRRSSGGGGGLPREAQSCVKRRSPPWGVDAQCVRRSRGRTPHGLTSKWTRPSRACEGGYRPSITDGVVPHPVADVVALVVAPRFVGQIQHIAEKTSRNPTGQAPVVCQTPGGHEQELPTRGHHRQHLSGFEALAVVQVHPVEDHGAPREKPDDVHGQGDRKVASYRGVAACE